MRWLWAHVGRESVESKRRAAIAALHQAARALFGGLASQGAGGAGHRAAVHIRLNHQAAAGLLHHTSLYKPHQSVYNPVLEGHILQTVNSIVLASVAVAHVEGRAISVAVLS